MLTEDMKQLRNEIESMEGERERLLKELRRGVEERHVSVAAKLNEFRSFMAGLGDETAHRRKTVRGMMTGFHANLARVAKRTQAERCAFMRQLERETGRRRKTVMGMMADCHDVRARLGEDTRSALRDFVSGLRGSTAFLRQGFASDLAGARQAFHGPGPRTGTPAAPRQAEPRPDEKAAGKAADDLTAVPGIGHRLQERLNKAGIRTFAQLANSTQQMLRHILGDSAGPANPEQWIEQARELAKK